MKQIEIKYNADSPVNDLMWQIIRQLIKCKKHILDQFGLTCSQFEILSALYQYTKTKEEIIQIDLSEKTQIDPMTTSTILRNLQKKGMVTRNRSLINTRTVIVGLTPKGRSLHKSALDKICELNNFIYQNTNEKLLMSQLLILSDKINKLKF